MLLYILSTSVFEFRFVCLCFSFMKMLINNFFCSLTNLKTNINVLKEGITQKEQEASDEIMNK